MPALTRRDLPTLLLILFVAAVARLGAPGVVEFRHDEAMLSLKALDWLRQGDFPVTGIPSSVGVPNPPISVYIMALPYLFTNNPLVATLFVAALNVAGVGLLWWLARRVFGVTTALVAGLVYAANPWAILYSRKIWAQDFHTPFLLLALLVGVIGFVDGKRWAQIATLPLLMIALQIHFAAWALLPLFAVLVWLGRRQTRWATLGIGVLLALLTLVPYAAGLAQTLSADPDRFDDLLTGRGSGLALSADALIYNAQLASGIGMERELAPAGSDSLLAAVPAPTQVWALTGGLALLGLVIVWREKRGFAPLLTLWVLLPVVIFTPTWTPVFSHYFIASLPAFALLTGVSVGWLTQRLPGQPLSRTIVLMGVAMIALSQVIWWRGALRYVDATYTPGGFGTPLHNLLDIRDRVAPEADVMLVSDGVEILYDQDPAVWSVLLTDSGRCLRVITAESSQQTVIPASAYTLLLAPVIEVNPDDYPPAAAPTPLPLRPGEPPYHIISTEPTSADLPDQQSQADSEIGRWANAVTLTDYRHDSAAVTLRWRLPDSTLTDYHYFVHLLDENGTRLTQHDDALLPGRFWCSGDHLLTTAPLTAPVAATTVRVGMYTLRGSDGFVNVPALDEGGAEIGLWVDLPLERERP